MAKTGAKLIEDKLVNEAVTFTDDVFSWWESPELSQAQWDWKQNGEKGLFQDSPEYRNARLAFRRRMNKSPASETT